MPTGPSDPSVMPSDRPRAGAKLLRLMLKPWIALSAFSVSRVVGTALNAIDNGGQFWTNHKLNLWQAALNFVVPFCVPSYSAARNEAQRARGD